MAIKALLKAGILQLVLEHARRIGQKGIVLHT